MHVSQRLHHPFSRGLVAFHITGAINSPCRLLLSEASFAALYQRSFSFEPRNKSLLHHYFQYTLPSPLPILHPFTVCRRSLHQHLVYLLSISGTPLISLLFSYFNILPVYTFFHLQLNSAFYTFSVLFTVSPFSSLHKPFFFTHPSMFLVYVLLLSRFSHIFLCKISAIYINLLFVSRTSQNFNIPSFLHNTNSS